MSTIGKAYAESPLHQIDWEKFEKENLENGYFSKITEDNQPFFEAIPISEFEFPKEIIMTAPSCRMSSLNKDVIASPRKMRYVRKTEYQTPYSKLTDISFKKTIIDYILKEISSYKKEDTVLFVYEVIEARNSHILADYVINEVTYIFRGAVYHK